MSKEIDGARASCATRAAQPFVAVLGGAKVSDKIGVLEALLERVDALLIGGAMANTFLAAQGVNDGQEPGRGGQAPARAQHDAARAKKRREAAACRATWSSAGASTPSAADVVDVDARAAPTTMALDIGPTTVEAFRRVILPAKAVFWNGPMGLFEKPPFARRHASAWRAPARTARASPWSAAATASRP